LVFLSAGMMVVVLALKRARIAKLRSLHETEFYDSELFYYTISID
jgi:hypothetical protein